MGNNLLNSHKLEIENLYLAVVIFTCPEVRLHIFFW